MRRLDRRGRARLTPAVADSEAEIRNPALSAMHSVL
jgi:hypothetical protein